MFSPEKGGSKINPEMQKHALEYCSYIESTLTWIKEKKDSERKIQEKLSAGEEVDPAAQTKLEELKSRVETAISLVIHNSEWDELKFNMFVILPENEGIVARTSENWVKIIDPDPKDFTARKATMLNEDQIDFSAPDGIVHLSVFHGQDKLRIMPIFPEAIETGPQETPQPNPPTRHNLGL